MENHLSELLSIFAYLMPGFLYYSYPRFREELKLPIVQDNSENEIKRLQKMIRPFVPRRLKKDVLERSSGQDCLKKTITPDGRRTAEAL